MVRLSDIKKHDMCSDCLLAKSLFPVGEIATAKRNIGTAFQCRELSGLDRQFHRDNFIDRIMHDFENGTYNTLFSEERITIPAASKVLIVNHFHGHSHEKEVYKYLGVIQVLWNNKLCVVPHSYEHQLHGKRSREAAETTGFFVYPIDYLLNKGVGPYRKKPPTKLSKISKMAV